MLSFLAGRAQLTASEVKESQSIASVKIHVESAIQRVNPNLGGNLCWFSLNNSETVRAVTLAFCIIQ